MRSTYIVLSFDLSSHSGCRTRQAFRRFDDLAPAMIYGAGELLTRNGVLILRSAEENAGTATNLQPVAACGVAEERAVALYAVSDFKLGRWPITDSCPEPLASHPRRAQA